MSSATAGVVPQWTVADRLRKAREHAGMTQAQLAETIGVAQRSVSAYENGQTTPRRPVALAWALATHVPFAWIVGDDDPMSKLGRPTFLCMSDDRTRARHLTLKLWPAAVRLTTRLAA